MAEFERDALPLAPNHLQASPLHGCSDVFLTQDALWRCYYCLHAGGPTRCIVRVHLGPKVTTEHPSSDLRQVPDTQEVYLDPQSNVSLILEILVRVEPNNLNDAAVWAGTSIGADLN